jgi:hypothetical protein
MLQRTKPMHSPSFCAYNLTINQHAYFVGTILFRFGFNALARNWPEFSNWHGACEGNGNFP